MYSQLFFNKPIGQVELKDVQDFFAEAKVETDTLEFKSFGGNEKGGLDQKYAALFRTISGFLNSNGGLLIWGAPKDEELRRNDGLKEKLFKGELSPVPLQIEKDAFIVKAVTSISPSPQGISFHSIPMENNAWIYLIEVLPSQYPPHQYDGRYYMRLDGHNRIAPHHYIEALMKQIRMPNVTGLVQTNFQTESVGDYGIIPFVFSLDNLSRNLSAKDVQYSLMLDKGWFFFADEKIAFNKRFSNRNVIQQPTEKNLIYNLPFKKAFFLVLPDVWNTTGVFTLGLYWFGSNVPFKISKYHFEYFSVPPSPTPQIKLIKKQENIFAADTTDKLGMTEEDRILFENSNLLGIATRTMHSQPMYKRIEDETKADLDDDY
jgi:hypothetical protein